jgi:hypothetical protein
MRVGARVQAYRTCSGADARHAYRVETATLPRAENVDVGKLSGGNLNPIPFRDGEATAPLISERVRDCH